MAIYAKYVMTGVNFNAMQNVRSKTVRGYVLAAAELFTLRNFRSPVSFDNKQNWVNIIVSNLEREEDIAKQRSPITKEMFAELKRMADAKPFDSAESMVFNMAAFGRITGPRAGEYAQTTQNKVDVHRYPSGREVVKAFLAGDFHFYDRDGNPMTITDDSAIDLVGYMRVIWRIQKNRQNGQGLRVDRCKKFPALCPVLGALMMILRKLRLGHSLDLPLAVFKDKSDVVRYLTGAKVAEILRKAARTVHPKLTKEEINKFSAHSLRVWACVLLDEAGIKPDTIKKRLRWMGESYRIYLRDTQKISEQHIDALDEASEAVMALLEAAASDIVPTLTEEDTTMGSYQDLN